MKFKRWISILMVAVMLLCTAPTAFAADSIVDSGKCGDNLKWTLDEDGVLTVSYIQYNAVTKIATGDDGALVINKVVPEILPNITYPVEGGNIYFNPNDGEIYDCDLNVTAVNIPDEINGYPVTCIDQYAFNGCQRLVSIALPSSVTDIHEEMIGHCDNLQEITVDANNPVFTAKDGVLFTKDMSTLFAYPCSRIDTNYIIPEGVTKIGDYAFWYCSTIKNLVLPNSIKEIGESAFEHCEKLGNLKLPYGLTSIGDTAFRACESMTKIEIPGSVTSIGLQAISGCLNLTSLTIAEGVETLGANAIIYCPKLTSLHIPASVSYIEDGLCVDCPRLVKVTISADNKHYIIKEDVLFTRDMTELLRYFPYKVDKKYDVPKGVTRVGCSSFEGARNLVNITLPSSATTIEVSAFSGCKKLSTITIPFGVKIIEDSVFSECSSLRSVVIPHSVELIASGAFNYCSNLKDIYYTGTEEEWGIVIISPVYTAEVRNATKHYEYSPPSQPEVALATKQSFEANGVSTDICIYNINGYNYFKLRDIAALCDSTSKAFSVGYDSASGTISLNTSGDYTPSANDIKPSDGENKTATSSKATVLINGKKVTLISYNIDGYTYYQLRELCEVLNIGVVWNEQTQTMGFDTSKGYYQTA